jgi:hypothetical protein
MSSRREFLRTAALSAAATAVLPHLLKAAPENSQNAQPATSGPREFGLIDLHSHWFSPASVEILSKRSSGPKFTTNEKGSVFSRVPE